MALQKITPFLWFDGQAEQAAQFYTSIFPNSKIVRLVRSGPANAVLTAEFQLEGLTFVALNGGPMFKFTEAVSFVVNCQTQDEVDFYWERLSAGGREFECGWVKDPFGLSWQIVPKQLPELISDPDPKKSAAVFQAMMKMKKLDIRGLQQAHDSA